MLEQGVTGQRTNVKVPRRHISRYVDSVKPVSVFPVIADESGIVNLSMGYSTEGVYGEVMARD